MAIFKCKMCGGDLNIEDGSTVCECEYCGTKQTVPSADNEKKVNLFNRANRLRSGCDFDKAAGVYESIVAEFPEEAEAYWGLCLCKFGIEYVDDPATAKKVPTCHRTSYDDIFHDNNFGLACEYADSVARQIYRSEAKEIDRLQKEILDIAKNEEPFDIFICYKETASDGQRTKDSVLAQDIYDTLTEKGYKVFFSRITLEDKLGQDYEPYIFSALNSAKVMLVIGTDYEHFNAVWVKNEWSRYLALMSKDKSKTLIPCYCDIDAYDMPEEFKHLQGQDMGKVGFIQDLVRGIGKIIPKAAQQTAPTMNVTSNAVMGSAVNTAAVSLMKRGYLALEDRDWKNADKFLEEALNADAECAPAYIGKYLVQNSFTSLDSIVQIAARADTEVSFSEKYLKHDDAREKALLEKYAKYIANRGTFEDVFRRNLAYSTRTEALLSHIEKEKSNLERDKYWTKALRFADENYKGKITAVRNKLYQAFDALVTKSKSDDEAARMTLGERYESAERELQKIYSDNEKLEEENRKRREKEREEQNENAYSTACNIQEQLSNLTMPKKRSELKKHKAYCETNYLKAEGMFDELGDYKDSAQRLRECREARENKLGLVQKTIDRIKVRNIKKFIVIVVSVCVVTAAGVLVPQHIEMLKIQRMQLEE